AAPAPPARSAATAPAGGDWRARAARYAPAGAAALVMVVLGLWGLARDSAMGNDEVATRWAALLSLRDLAHLLNNQDAVHGFYYLLMHFWAAAGSSPAVLRIPSVVAMAAAVALVAILTGRLTGSGWAGLFAGLVMALIPMISFYAQTARSYAMVLACVVAATLVLVRALDAEAAGAGGQRVTRWWLGYGALVAVGGYLNEMSLLVLAAHAVTVLAARYGTAVARRWAVTAAVSVALVVPLILISIREDAAVTWIPRPGLGALRVLFHDYFGSATVLAVILLACAVIAVLPGGGGPAGPGPAAGAWWRGGVSLPSVAAPLMVAPALLLVFESLVARPFYVDRYVLYGAAGAAMLAGTGLWRAGRWLARRSGSRPGLVWVPGVAVCVCALVLQLGPQHRIRTPASRLFDFGGPSAYVGANARQGDGVMFFGNLFRKARLGYPQDYTKTTDFGMAKSPERTGSFRGTDKPFPAVRPLLLGYQRVWVIGHVPSPRLPAGLLRSESAVLQQNFRLAAERRFKGIVVTLWQRR
ncbi:MAG TPA: glycosyltransferase family 39 protein, partial [Streptosporangiaceae bacterium]|nr:glycosyltransferase family 39 protein [Streptosporangiaceae bacterium]